MVAIKNMIDYKQANSITARGLDEFSTPVINAVLGDQREFSTIRPDGRVSEVAARYYETPLYYPVFEDLIFIHPQIPITVLRL